MRHRTLPIALILAAVPLIGCAAAEPTKELLRARSLYAQAASGPANQYERDHVIEAKTALTHAERMHEEEPQSLAEKHLAYIAQRKALLAIAHGDYTKAAVQTEQAEESFTTLSEKKRRQAKQQLQTARYSLRETGQELSSTKGELSSTKGDLEEERERRQQLEAALAEAMRNLEAFAKVKADDKRWIITLSGQVLFESGKSQLMGVARSRLDKVADALKAAGASKKFIVHGFTDSVGTDEYNQQLSQSRAEAVRSYLVSQGVDASQIQAKGMGEQNPIADNSTPEGRANNRRVEIVVEDR